MNIKRSFADLTVDIKPTGVKINDYLLNKVENMIKSLKKSVPELSWMDVHLKETEEETNARNIVVRFGVPGTDIVASDSGDRWKTVIKNIEKRLIRQLEKRKVLPVKHQQTITL
jgi:putative sigma-54 modulation protein